MKRILSELGTFLAACCWWVALVLDKRNGRDVGEPDKHHTAGGLR